MVTGLLARGLAEIGPRGGQEGWRWIFIIEGLLASIFTATRRLSLTQILNLDDHVWRS